MKKCEYDLTSLVPEFPEKPHSEIAHDALINLIVREFRENSQKQIVISDDFYGKTNLLAQFCRKHKSSAISYFITSNPITQNYLTFLFVICNQISRIVGGPNLSIEISEKELVNIYPGLVLKLGEFTETTGQKFYIVIDGIEFALDSEPGQKIIENPPILLSSWPYLLLSSNLVSFEKLPNQWKKNIKQQNLETALLFDNNDIVKYFSGLDLTKQEFKILTEKSRGIAGYLSVLRDTIFSSDKDSVFSEELPDSLKRLINSQVECVFKKSSDTLISCLQMIAIAPKPINADILIEYFGGKISIDKIKHTGLVQIGINGNALSIKQILTKQIIQDLLGNQKTEVTKRLLEAVKKSSVEDDELVTLILTELKDYNGLVDLLDVKSIKFNIDAGRTNTVIERMRKACKLSLDTHDFKETSKMCWGLAATKEFLSHAATTDEIKALISIGDSKKALELAYNFPESISKIRLLANVYSSMKENHEHVPSKAIEELEVLINEEEIYKLEKEVIQGIALDILPILPDRAYSLLANVIIEQNEQNLIDVALSAVRKNDSEIINKYSETDSIRLQEQKIEFGIFTRLNTSWFKDSNLAKLIKEVENLENTKAKEFFIRQWCLQNPKHEELSYGIEYWLDTVIHDEDFSISLRSLRQLSENIKSLGEVDRRRLIDRFQVSSFASLRTPWEEWVGFHLNIAEAMYDFAPDHAIEKVNDIYSIVNTQINDYDIKLFCYARLWVTFRSFGLNDSDNVKSNFERVLCKLLENSALQDVLLKNTQKILSGIDINYAISIADRLNTEDRRTYSKILVLINAYIKQPNKDLSLYLRQAIKDLDSYQREYLIFKLLEEISEKHIQIDDKSQKILYYQASEIENQIIKSASLIDLATIWTNNNVTKVNNILKQAQTSWEKEDDLKKKIKVGFQLVEKISNIDPNFAREFCNSVQSTLIFPGAELAIGTLGIMYFSSIMLAIRSLDINLINDQDYIERLFQYIERLPTALIQNELYTQLAARIYNIGLHPKANDIVEQKILKNLKSQSNKHIRENIIYFSLPIIFQYRPEIAKNLSKEIPKSNLDNCWFNVLLWIVTHGLLGDINDWELIKTSNTPDTLRDKAVVALEQIKQDAIIYAGVTVITRSIEHSVLNHQLDVVNAYDILLFIDKLIIENCDNRNIQHCGYKIISQARVNRARSQILRLNRRRGPFSKVVVKNKWRELEISGKNDIKNLADRIFVITHLAKDLFVYDPDRAKNLLESISDDIKNIPALIDRIDRLNLIAETWGLWGNKAQANYYFSQCIELINELSSWSQDRKLEQIVQAAYGISPDFADELVKRLDSRYPDKVLNPLTFKMKSMIYSDNISVLLADFKEKRTEIQGIFIESSVNNMFTKLVNEDGSLPTDETINELIYMSSFYKAHITNDVLKWAIECNNRKLRRNSPDISEVFSQSSNYINQLARWISPSVQKGIPQEIYNNLPGLSSKVIVFNIGDQKRAEDWIRGWLDENVEEYIKLCDPYFGPDQLWLFRDIPKNIKILIITTTKYFQNKNDPEEMKQELLYSWKIIGKGKIPPMALLVVPTSLRHTFHDRALVTKSGGLDIGPSLNSLGNKLQKLTELDFKDAKDLEATYIENMLHQGKWFLDYSIRPKYIVIE